MEGDDEKGHLGASGRPTIHVHHVHWVGHNRFVLKLLHVGRLQRDAAHKERSIQLVEDALMAQKGLADRAMIGVSAASTRSSTSSALLHRTSS